MTQFQPLSSTEESTTSISSRSKCKGRGCCLLIVIIGLLIFGIFSLQPDDSSTGETKPHDSDSDKNDNITSSSDSTVTISTKLGQIKGNIWRPSPVADPSSWIYEFLGIEYGLPPVGDMRFRPCVLNNKSFSSQHLDSRNINRQSSVYDATQYGSACPQYLTAYENMSEDCLHLNIWTPKKVIDNISKGGDTTIGKNGKNNHDTDPNTNTKIQKTSVTKLPVMVFIHGGSFTMGAGNDVNGTLFINRGGNNIVYVSINYRLGIFGFLQTEMLYNEGISGIYGYKWPSYGGSNGIYDQIQAIRWVYDNIDQFGGNPDNITIMGESAGGQSVCSILISPLLRENNRKQNRLFKQAIVESGPCFGPWQLTPFDQGTQLTEQVLNNGTIYGPFANNLTFLRSLTWFVYL